MYAIIGKLKDGSIYIVQKKPTEIIELDGLRKIRTYDSLGEADMHAEEIEGNLAEDGAKIEICVISLEPVARLE